jgi:hypothetical protein
VKYSLISMRPISDFDSVLTFQSTPSRLEQLLGRRSRVVRYFGSGITWRNGRHGPLCNSFTSEWLHGIWNDQLKRAADARKLDRSGNGSSAGEPRSL